MKAGSNWSQKILPVLVFTVFAVACDDGGGNRDLPAVYFGLVTFSMVDDVTGEQNFVALTTDFDLVQLARAESQLPMAERTLFPVGPLDRGDDSYNLNWSWHFQRDEWNLTDSADPSCDGNAVIVEQAVDYWVDTVGQFCPAGARIVNVTEAIS